MKKFFAGFFYSLPVQLVFLHFRRYQVLLLFWVILFATISGNFLKPYGADSLMLDPEYLGIKHCICWLRFWFIHHELEHYHVYFAYKTHPVSCNHISAVFKILHQQCCYTINIFDLLLCVHSTLSNT